MKVFATTLATLLTLTVLAGCDSRNSHEAIAEDMVGKMREMVDVIKGIKDEASAKAAKPKLEAIKKDVEELKAKGDKLGKPTPEAEKAMKDKHEKELDEITGEMMKEMMRVAMDPKLAPHLQETMSGFDPI